MEKKPELTFVQEILDKDPQISETDLAQRILSCATLDPIDLWLLPQYAFNKWRRKYDYPVLLNSIKKNQADFNDWMAEQKISDDYLLNGYFSDFFQNKPSAKDKILHLVKRTYKGEEEYQVWHSYDGTKSTVADGETIYYELIVGFISYYDWLLTKGRAFRFTQTFFNTHQNSVDEEVYLNMNTRLLKLGGMIPPINGVGMLFRGKKLEFVNLAGLELNGNMYFGSRGRLEILNSSLDNLKCNDMNVPGLFIENSLVRNLQIRNSVIDHWQFINCYTTGNIIDSKLSFIRIFGGLFNPIFTNSTISDIFLNHSDYSHHDNFEKTYRSLAKCAKESGDENLAQHLKIKEYDFVRENSNRGKWLLMTIDKLYWSYGQKPERLIWVMIISILLFGFLYSFFPNNFSDTTEGMKGEPYLIRLGNSIYYSVVTFTTLGYGDISPKGFLRVIAGVEAIFGAITLGFLVAGLSRRD